MSEAQQFRLTTRDDARRVFQYIGQLFGDAEKLEKPMVMKVTESKADRSLAQNRLSHRWYKERAEQTGTTPDYEHQLCKLRQGCPILIESDADFARIYEKVIQPLPYEDRIKAMAYMPITSIMGVKQMTLYLNNVERDSIASGMTLTHPDDLYYEAMK